MFLKIGAISIRDFPAGFLCNFPILILKSDLQISVRFLGTFKIFFLYGYKPVRK